MSARHKPPGSAGALFLSAFRRHVIPSLVTQCQVQGLFVALDRSSFADAHRLILRAAIGRGALHLQPKALDDLDEWIATSLVDVAMSRDPEIVEAQRIADRVATQLDRHFAAIAAVSDQRR